MLVPTPPGTPAKEAVSVSLKVLMIEVLIAHLTSSSSSFRGTTASSTRMHVKNNLKIIMPNASLLAGCIFLFHSFLEILIFLFNLHGGSI
jgi:hypothetical protein